MRTKLQIWGSSAVPNIRRRWPKEMEPFSDAAIARMYDDFYFSDDAGDNDEKLPEWFASLADYETEND